MLDFGLENKRRKQARMLEIEQEVLKYLEGRKTAATLKQMSKFFIHSESYMSRVLANLENQNLVTCIKAGGTKLYVHKDKVRT